MPTLIRERRATTPLQKAAEAVRVANAPDAPRPKRKNGQPAVPPPDFGPRCDDPADLSPPLLYRREMAYAMCYALRFERWLLEFIAAAGIPLDSCILPVTLLPIYVEACFKARIAFPGCLPAPVEPADDESDAEAELAWDIPTAVAEGLSVHCRPERTRPLPANLPGCNGTDDSGNACARLRRYGERFCPVCRRKELERMRQGG